MDKIQARSRLKKPIIKEVLPSERLVKKNTKQKPLLKAYLQYIICLFIALICYYFLYLLVKNVYPSQIQNFLWTNSYLPFFIVLFVANFFLLTFFFLDKKIGLALAVLLNLVIYFKITQIKLDLYSFSFLTTSATILLLFVFYIPKINSSKQKKTIRNST